MIDLWGKKSETRWFHRPRPFWNYSKEQKRWGNHCFKIRRSKGHEAKIN